ncbi:hypothetical protein Gpo141_00010385 [Globisporangium polare]
MDSESKFGSEPSSPADLDDDHLKLDLDAIIDSVKSSELPGIDNVFEPRVKINLRESDVNARIIKYFNLCGVVFEENGQNSLFNGTIGTKQAAGGVRRAHRAVRGDQEPAALQCHCVHVRA